MIAKSKSLLKKNLELFGDKVVKLLYKFILVNILK